LGRGQHDELLVVSQGEGRRDASRSVLAGVLQRHDVAGIASDDIKCRQKSSLAAVVGPGDQDKAVLGQCDLRMPEGPEVLGPHVTQSHPTSFAAPCSLRA